MRSIRLPLALLLSWLFFSSHASAQVGLPLPQTRLTELNSETLLNTQDLKGKVVYLDFWASWCGPCRKSFPFMNQLQKRYGHLGLEIVAINMDKDLAAANEFLAQVPANFKLYQSQETDLAKVLKVPGLPVAYLIDREGMIVARHIGFNMRKIPGKVAEIEALLKAQ